MRLFITVILFFFSTACLCQEVNVTEAYLESGAETRADENGEDEFQLEAEGFLKHPLDLNKATGKDLERLQILTPVQIERIIRYRNVFGPFLSVYELQAVTGCEPALLRKLRPFIFTGQERNGLRVIPSQLQDAGNRFVIRYVRILEKAAGYHGDSTVRKFAGGPGQWQLRYITRFKKEWQAGFLAEKDAGESFFRGRKLKGFDFTSFHLFVRGRGRCRAFAAGDYTVGMGQGLIQWQGMGTGKSSEVMLIQKRDEVLKSYQSAGESAFFRGAGMTLAWKRTELTLFLSSRMKDANLVHDSAGHPLFFSSLNLSGLHRTHAENADRKRLSEQAAGMLWSRLWKDWKVSLNAIGYRFGIPLQKRDEPYNIYTWKGREWYNASVSWAGNIRNVHVFGEMAADRGFHPAILAGMILSADPRADLSVLYRHISSGYQAVAGSAFTAGTQPANEAGIYLGLCIRPAMGWTLGLYADLYRFPWLKYNVDGPSAGAEYFIDLRFTPDKILELYSRFRYTVNQVNVPAGEGLPVLSGKNRATWRTQIGYKLNRDLALRGRAEVSVSGFQGGQRDHGFLWFTDLLYKPLGKPYSVVARTQFFDTDSYDSRIYAYENDILYSYSLPGFSGRGLKYYLLFSADVGRNCSIWLRFGRLIQEGNEGFGTGPEKISENHRTDLKIEVRCLF